MADRPVRLAQAGLRGRRAECAVLDALIRLCARASDGHWLCTGRRESQVPTVDSMHNADG
jgi:hypothetical protein